MSVIGTNNSYFSFFIYCTPAAFVLGPQIWRQAESISVIPELRVVSLVSVFGLSQEAALPLFTASLPRAAPLVSRRQRPAGVWPVCLLKHKQSCECWQNLSRSVCVCEGWVLLTPAACQVHACCSFSLWIDDSVNLSVFNWIVFKVSHYLRLNAILFLLDFS